MKVMSGPDENGQVTATFGPSMIVKPDGTRRPAVTQEVKDDAENTGDSNK